MTRKLQPTNLTRAAAFAAAPRCQPPTHRTGRQTYCSTPGGQSRVRGHPPTLCDRIEPLRYRTRAPLTGPHAPRTLLGAPHTVATLRRHKVRTCSPAVPREGCRRRHAADHGAPTVGHCESGAVSAAWAGWNGPLRPGAVRCHQGRRHACKGQRSLLCAPARRRPRPHQTGRAAPKGGPSRAWPAPASCVPSRGRGPPARSTPARDETRLARLGPRPTNSTDTHQHPPRSPTPLHLGTPQPPANGRGLRRAAQRKPS